MKKTVLIIMLILASVFAFTGFAAAEDTREFTDDLGRTLTLPVNLDAVSPSGPVAQIVLYSMSPESFVSVATKLSDIELKYLDKRLSSLPVTGQFYGSRATMNAEEIMQLNKELNIDVVLDVGGVKSGIENDLNDIQEKTGVNFAFITQDKLSDIPNSYVRLGELLGMEEQGKKLSAYSANLIKEFEENMKKVGDNKVSMIYVTKVDGNSVSLIGSGEKSYHGEIVNFIAENAAPVAVSSSGLGDTYSLEDILKINPEYIIVSGTDDHAYYNEIVKSEMWNILDAVKNGKVYEAPYCPYSWMGNPPSVHKMLSIIWLGNLFYPDVFDYNLKDRAVEFYNLFFHHTLTDAEYDELTVYAKDNSVSPKPTSSPVPLIGLLFAAAVCLILFRRK